MSERLADMMRWPDGADAQAGECMAEQTNHRDWVSEYNRNHQHPVNRACHTVGIPMIVVSIVLGLVAIGVQQLWSLALGLFILGWVLQGIGHVVEGRPPAFFRDWRFLFTGLSWWVAKLRGKH
jgi:uncharacterized membrane protein YGL010W